MSLYLTVIIKNKKYLRSATRAQQRGRHQYETFQVLLSKVVKALKVRVLFGGLCYLLRKLMIKHGCYQKNANYMAYLTKYLSLSE